MGLLLIASVTVTYLSNIIGSNAITKYAKKCLFLNGKENIIK